MLITQAPPRLPIQSWTPVDGNILGQKKFARFTKFTQFTQTLPPSESPNDSGLRKWDLGGGGDVPSSLPVTGTSKCVPRRSNAGECRSLSRSGCVWQGGTVENPATAYLHHPIPQDRMISTARLTSREGPGAGPAGGRERGRQG